MITLSEYHRQIGLKRGYLYVLKCGPAIYTGEYIKRNDGFLINNFSYCINVIMINGRREHFLHQYMFSGEHTTVLNDNQEEISLELL